MNKKLQNQLTTVLGLLMWGSIIPGMFLLEDDIAVKLISMFFIGAGAIYFKNEDLKALTKNYFKKFTV